MLFRDVNLNELFRLMQEYDIAETSLSDGKMTVVAKRGKEPVVTESNRLMSYTATYTPPPTAELPKTDPKPADVNHPGKEESTPTVPGKFHSIMAPLVGTFYRSSSPGAESFIDIGDRVKTGDVLCIIEAMKSMNEIQSDVNGVVKEICVENGHMVEFDQVLFKVDTTL